MSSKIRLFYNDLLTLSDDDEPSIPSGVRVKGVAFRSGVIASKGVFIPDGELENVTRTLEGAPFLIDHSHSIRDVCGTVTSTWQENSLVKFKGEIVEEEIAEKVRRGLVNSVSVGLHVQDIEDITLDGQALKKLNGITVKELSLVLFPAVEGATFEPSFEFSIEVEADENHPVEAQLSKADFLAMEELLVAKGKIVMDRADFEAITNQLEEMNANNAKMERALWLYSNCDPDFIEEILPKIDKFSLGQLSSLYDTYNNFQARISDLRGVVAEEQELNTTESKKEDVRELIFGIRRDGTPIGKIRDINDIR